MKRGQVLARLDDSQLRAQLALAEAQARRGARGRHARTRSGSTKRELTLDRRQQLVKDKVIVARPRSTRPRRRSTRSTARIAMAQQQVEVAQSAGATRAQTDLDDMIIRAPFDGVAISKDAQPGEMISPVSAGGGFTRTGICTIVDMSSLEIEVDVNESYINRVKPAQPVEAVLDAYPDWRIPGARHHDRADGGSAEGDGAGAHRLRPARSAHPAGHGRQGVVPARSGRQRAGGRRRRGRGCSCRRARCARRTAASVVFVVRDDRVERRAVKIGAHRRRPDRSAVGAAVPATRRRRRPPRR